MDPFAAPSAGIRTKLRNLAGDVNPDPQDVDDAANAMSYFLGYGNANVGDGANTGDA